MKPDDAGGPLPPGVDPGVDGETVTQTFEITGLGGIWLPAAFSPVRVWMAPTASPSTLRPPAWSSASATSDGLSYSVESVLPRYDVARLRAADTPPTGDVAERYLALPADFPAELADQARSITAGASTRYDQAIALQNWFRGFTYDLSFRAGQSQIRHAGLPRPAARLLRAVRRHLRRLRPRARPAVAGRGRVHPRRTARRRPLLRPGQARPRVARDLLRRCRLGAVRAHPRAGQPGRRAVHRRRRRTGRRRR